MWAIGRGAAERIAGVANEDVAGFARVVKLASESCAIHGVGLGMEIGMERSCLSPECIANLVDGRSWGHAEVSSRFVESHAIAVK
ncbi:hypothetical protein ASD65_06315 [Microbacterium sp. Root61]|nr:hypothetical protein ASD65_06315 [Microbacterium sp. Root61]